MEEKILSKSEHYAMKYFYIFYAVIAFVIANLMPRIIRIGAFGFLYNLFYIIDCVIKGFVIFILLTLLHDIWLSKCSLTVTNKRIYGTTVFGKRVDLPLDSVSAVGTSFLKGIDVGTSSGRIKFKLIKNQEEIHSVVSKLLIERQQSEKANSTQNNEKSGNADELKKYKDLLDNGIITQEEFEQKKKQLLGL